MEGYSLKKKMGQGSFSIVYQAVRNQDQKVYALKKIQIKELHEKARQSCINEVRILASIDNPYILQYKQSFFDQKLCSFCIITQFLEGGDLSQAIIKNRSSMKTFKEDQIWRYAGQLLQGIAALHKVNIMHRDIKSANIFLSKDQSEAKLGDMNISIVSPDGMAKTQTGTPFYASPEVWSGKLYNLKCDIWSFGCVIYEMANLKTPFIASNVKDLQKVIGLGSYNRIPMLYSDDLEAFIRLCLVVDPKKRASATELLNNPILQKYMKAIGQETYVSEGEKPVLAKIEIPSIENFKAIESKLPRNNFNEDIRRLSLSQARPRDSCLDKQNRSVNRNPVTKEKVIIRFISEKIVDIPRLPPLITRSRTNC